MKLPNDIPEDVMQMDRDTGGPEDLLALAKESGEAQPGVRRFRRLSLLHALACVLLAIVLPKAMEMGGGWPFIMGILLGLNIDATLATLSMARLSAMAGSWRFLAWRGAKRQMELVNKAIQEASNDTPES